MGKFSRNSLHPGKHIHIGKFSSHIPMISANSSEISAIKRASSLSYMNAMKILIGKQLRAEIIIGTNEFTANNRSSLEH